MEAAREGADDVHREVHEYIEALKPEWHAALERLNEESRADAGSRRLESGRR